MKVYSGIDLHSNNNVVVVSDEADRVLYRARLPNELGKVLEALESYRGELVGVVVESTYNWYWLVDGLQAAGYQVHLANTAGRSLTMGSNAVMTIPMRRSWRGCCGWGFCARRTSIRWPSAA